MTRMLADLTGRVHLGDGAGGMRFSTNAHGFDALECPFIPMSLVDAFAVYEWPGTPHVVVTDTIIGTVWEGRLEDIAIVDGGVSLVAFGYQRAMHDVPYTGMWSKSGSADWETLPDTLLSWSHPDLFETDNNNRLYHAFRVGETYDAAVGSYWYIGTPDAGARKITNLSLSYDVKLPTNWRLMVYYTDDFSTATEPTIVTGNGSQQTGSYSLTLATPRNYIAIGVYNNTGGATTISTGSTGDNYAKVTSVRIKTTTETSVLASDIAKAMVNAAYDQNTDQISADKSLIAATTTDLYDELYEDTYPAEILDRLAELHGYEWGVYEGRRLYFREKGSGGRHWYVDVTNIINLQRSLENVRNSAYSVYRDANGLTKRTANVGDTGSQARYGIVRRGIVNVNTTSLAEAQIHRGVYLDDRANASSRAEIAFSHLYDEAGGEFPLYALRAGDTLTMRNLPPSVSAAVDRIRTFVISETAYDALDDSISITPEAATPSLDRLIARREAGLR